MAKKTEVATAKTETALANYDYGVGPTGFEGQTQDDRETPLLILLQALSPACKKKGEGAVPGAEPGMFLNTATSELYDDDGVLFVPACTKQTFLEFVPREKGGGFVGMHDPDSGVVQRAKSESRKFGRYTMPNGNELTETFQVFAVLVTEHNDELVPVGMCVIPFSSTKIKAYKKWNTRCLTTMLPGQAKAAPLFANLVRMTSYETKNSANQDYYNVAISPAINGSQIDSLLLPRSPLALSAMEFCVSVQAGDKVAAEPDDNTSPTASQDRGPDGVVGDGKDAAAPF